MFCELTYGLKDGVLVHVDYVETGLACNCICANCSAQLVAKNKGLIREHHFAHYNAEECIGAVETALHLLAKQVFAKNKKIATPDFYYYSEALQFGTEIYNSKTLTFDRVELETRIDCNGSYFIPDAIGYIEGKPPFLIEFANTHFVGEDKYQKIKQGKYTCLEVSLWGTELDEKAVETLLHSKDNREWISYPSLEERAEQLIKQIFERESEKVRLKEAKELRRINEKAALKQEKLTKYTANPSVNIFNDKTITTSCPLVINNLKSLLDSSFTNNPTLNRIIKGEYWNGQIYGKIYNGYSNGKYIFLGKEKIYIYPEDKYFDKSQNSTYQFFWRGIKEIEKIRNSYDCWNCKYSVDILDTDTFEFQYVCSYPNDAEFLFLKGNGKNNE